MLRFDSVIAVSRNSSYKSRLRVQRLHQRNDELYQLGTLRWHRIHHHPDALTCGCKLKKRSIVINDLSSNADCTKSNNAGMRELRKLMKANRRWTIMVTSKHDGFCTNLKALEQFYTRFPRVVLVVCLGYSSYEWYWADEIAALCKAWRARNGDFLEGDLTSTWSEIAKWKRGFQATRIESAQLAPVKRHSLPIPGASDSLPTLTTKEQACVDAGSDDEDGHEEGDSDWEEDEDSGWEDEEDSGWEDEEDSGWEDESILDSDDDEGISEDHWTDDADDGSQSSWTDEAEEGDIEDLAEEEEL